VPTLRNPMRLAQSRHLPDISPKASRSSGSPQAVPPVEHASLGPNAAIRHPEMIHNFEVMEAALGKLRGSTTEGGLPQDQARR
jgi:hypothetical protein